MAGVRGNKNAVGNSGGKSLQDRKLAADVRRLALNRIRAILEVPMNELKAKDYELQKAILIKLAGTILPRLNEHTGESGKPIPILHKVLNREQADKILNRRAKKLIESEGYKLMADAK